MTEPIVTADDSIKIAIVVGAEELEPWQTLIAQEVHMPGVAEVVGVFFHGVSSGGVASKKEGVDPSIMRLYRKFDNRIFGASFSAMVGDQTKVKAEPVRMAQDSDKIDFFLDLTSNDLPEEITHKALRGVLSLAMGSRGFDAPSAGFFEVLGREDYATVDVCSQKDAAKTLLARSYTAVDPNSISRTISNAVINAIQLLKKVLQELNAERSASVFEAAPINFSQSNPSAPSAMNVATYAVKHAFSMVGRRLSRYLFADQWHVAFQIEGLGNSSATQIRYLEMPNDRFWADPFPVDAGDKFYIFFEEKLRSASKGTIAVATLDAEGHLEEVRPALDRPYHLSYPFIFEFEGARFMIPETGASGKIEVYREKVFPHEWELVDVLMDGIRAADCTLFERNGTWWMFAGRDYLGAQLGNEILSLFYADSPFGPWRPHPKNPIKIDITNARGAGCLFVRNNKIYRPAQDCSGIYGRALNFNEVTKLTKTEFGEKRVSRLEPAWDPSAKGLHTYNKHGRLTVMDVLVRRARL